MPCRTAAASPAARLSFRRGRPSSPRRRRPRAQREARGAHPRRHRRGRRLDFVRALHGARALRAGPRLLRGRRDQVRRRGRLRHRAGDDAAVRRGACRAGRGDPRRDAAARDRRARRRQRPARRRSAECAGRTRRVAHALRDPRAQPRPARAPARDDRRATRAAHLARVQLARDAARLDRRRGRSPTKCSTRFRCISSRAATAHSTSAASSQGDGPAAFAWADRPAGARLAALAAARFPPDGDYPSEINPAAEALVEDIGRRLDGGAALFIDYGFPAAEYYHPQRSRGTLMCHYRHRAHDDPFAVARSHRHHRARRFLGDGGGRRARGTGRRRLHRAGAVPAGLRHSRRAGARSARRSRSPTSRRRRRCRSC